MLKADQLACARGGRTVLSGVSLELAPGEVLGVLGANGAGKSSLLATLAGELPPGAGTATLDGQALSAWSARALARRRAVLPQSPSLAFDLPVRTVVEMGAYAFPEVSPAQLHALVDRALALADVTRLGLRRYATLSGGEQQRVQFARVLVQVLAAREEGDARLLFLDEPTASLDPRHQADLLGAVAALARAQRVAVLAVLHDVNLAAAWCTSLLLLAGGGPVALGPPPEVLTPETLWQVYGVRARVLAHPDEPAQPLVVFERAARA